jgi:hypothetical protein
MWITKLTILLAIMVMLSGCLEAADLVAERITAAAYCETPTGLTLCDADRSRAR